MFKPLRFLAAAALLAPALAQAQMTTTTTTTTTAAGAQASLEVTRLAPQLLAFAGGQANFDSLVNGLAVGTPVTLVSTLPTGQIQTVTFTPQGTMTSTQIAQTLEAARQSLISRGLATPSAQQLAISLTGGVLPTQTGNVQVNAALPATNVPTAAAGGTGVTGGVASPVTTTISPNNGTPSPSALIQGQSGAGGTTPPSPAQVIQNQREGNISNTPNATASSTPAPTAPSASAPLGGPAAGGSRFAAPVR